MPAGDERNQVAANIYADELEQTSKIFQKKADDARKKHFFPTDLKEQQELILGAHAFNLYLDPAYDDKYTGDWVDLFEPLVQQLNRDNNWSEDAYFIREVRHRIFSDGQPI